MQNAAKIVANTIGILLSIVALVLFVILPPILTWLTIDQLKIVFCSGDKICGLLSLLQYLMTGLMAVTSFGALIYLLFYEDVEPTKE